MSNHVAILVPYFSPMLLADQLLLWRHLKANLWSSGCDSGKAPSGLEPPVLGGGAEEGRRHHITSIVSQLIAGSFAFAGVL